MAKERRIVITGVGVVGPNGIGKDEYWQALRLGASGIRPITVFDSGLFKAHLAGEVVNFAPEKFLDPKALRIMDRSTRFLCCASKMAMDDAGIASCPADTDQIGVVTATTYTAMWNIAEFSKEAVDDGAQFVNPASFPGTTINAPSSQVSIRFGIKGFNTTISTGFAAGLDALKYAADFVALGRVKAVLVTGVESLSFQNFVGFHKVGFLSGLTGPEVSCPFDKRRNGMVLGEGACAVVIEDEEYARKRNARIYARLLSVDNSFDAYRSSKFHPTAEGLKKTMLRAIRDSGVAKEDINYICAAANSGQQQDALEVMAVKEVFATHAGKVPMSAIKSMIGESTSPAGIFQVAAAVGAIENSFLPPTINYVEKDPACGLDCVPNKAREAKVRTALVNNFGPGGNNASAVIAKYA